LWEKKESKDKAKDEWNGPYLIWVKSHPRGKGKFLQVGGCSWGVQRFGEGGEDWGEW